MEKDKIFFGENGLTTTSANTIANLAKESYQFKEEELNAIQFYNTRVKLLSSGEDTIISMGITQGIEDVPASLREIASLKSLIAWLREAIKAKENLIREARNLSYKDFGIEVPEQPICEDTIAEEDYIATLNIKQRNRYYYLDTLCAVLGNYIHPSGSYAKARKKLRELMNNPITISGSGRDAIVYTHEPSIDYDIVEDTFMSLQQEYRAYQSELNSMKHEMEMAIQEDGRKKSLAYQEAYAKWSYEMERINADFKIKKDKAIVDAQSLKIIIPDALKPIYDRVKSLGKK